MSQLLNLIKRMRDGKAITKKVVVVWALKRLEAMDWFREELRICRESAPPESVTCKFFVTAAVRPKANPAGYQGRAPRPLSNAFHDKLDGFVAGIASKRNSALIAAEAQGDPDKERELRREDEDRITALPQQKYLQPHTFPPPPPPGPPPSKTGLSPAEEALKKLEGRNSESKTIEHDSPEGKYGTGGQRKNDGEFHFPPLGARGAGAPHFNFAPPAGRQRYSQILAEADSRVSQAGGESASDTKDGQRKQQQEEEEQEVDSDKKTNGGPAPVQPPELAHLRTDVGAASARRRPTSTFGPPSGFDFGFPETPTEFQRSLMRFAFPVPHEIDGGWSVEYGRPDLGYMLREWATGGPDGRGILGRRTAVFVCGPPAMRVGVANTVARLQAEIWGDDMLEEIFLHTENYAL
jgi:hypothetical protein